MIKVEVQGRYITCCFLDSKIVKEDMLGLIQTVRDIFVKHWGMPVTLNFPNIGIDLVFENEQTIANFEKTVRVLIPHIVDRMVTRIEQCLKEETAPVPA